MKETDISLPFEAMWRQIVGPIAVLDLQGEYVDVNPAMCRMLGYDRDSLIKLHPAEVIHPDDEPVGRESVQQLISGKMDNFPLETRLVCSDGSIIWVFVRTSIVRRADGSPQVIVCQLHDITAYHELQVLWRKTVSNAPIGMALLDLNGNWTEVNGKLCDLVGYSRDELLTMRCDDLIDDLIDKRKHEEALEDMRNDHHTSSVVEVRYRHRDGDRFWMLVRLSVVPGPNDRSAYLVGQYETINGSAVRLSEERLAQLTRMALHDPLTGLANRALLIDRFEQELAGLADRGGMLAVLVIDLNKFKPVNDQYGHGVGDQLLTAAAQELLSAVRSSDTVARIGGDEFVVLTRVHGSAEAEALRAQVTQRLNTTVTVASGLHLEMSASVGLATTRNSTTSRKSCCTRPTVTCTESKNVAAVERDVPQRRLGASTAQSTTPPDRPG